MQVGREDQVRAEDQLRAEVDHGEKDVQPRRFLDPDDVQRDEEDDHDRPADDVPRVRLQRFPEDREVVRDEERGDRDRDDVVEHLRPRGSERDELVEGVAREGRRAARLRVAHRSLRVRGSGGREDQAADHEDKRSQSERNARDQPERVVDGGADVPVGGREKRRGPEHALEPLRPPSPPPPGRDGRTHALGVGRHARTLTPAAATYGWKRSAG